MDDERNEILNAIQNGFFNEGIYHINEGENQVPDKIKIPVQKTEEVKDVPYVTPEVITVAEETDQKLPLLPKNDKPENSPNTDDTPEFFGGNKKSVAIMVNYPDERWIYFKDKIILERILASVKLTFDDVALFNTHFFKPGSIEELSDKLKISKIIGFGINDPFVKGLKREEPEKTAKAAVFLMNSDLDEIAMNVAKKHILWNNLKLMFNIG